MYPIWSVDSEGVCTCYKGATCKNPVKHPATPNGIMDSSSDSMRIREMFSRISEPVGLSSLRPWTASDVSTPQAIARATLVPWLFHLF